MQIRLVWIERDFRGKKLSEREEILHGESAKNPTRNHVARLIARHHPELQFADRIMLTNASEEGYKWYVKATKADSGHWVYVYADPVKDAGPTRVDE